MASIYIVRHNMPAFEMYAVLDDAVLNMGYAYETREAAEEYANIFRSHGYQAEISEERLSAMGEYMRSLRSAT